MQTGVEASLCRWRGENVCVAKHRRTQTAVADIQTGRGRLSGLCPHASPACGLLPDPNPGLHGVTPLTPLVRVVLYSDQVDRYYTYFLAVEIMVGRASVHVRPGRHHLV